MLQKNILTALDDTPVVLLTGARQTGKTTLAASILKTLGHGEYVSFDDSAVLAAAASDPQGFIRSLPPCTVIDEVQRIPAVFTAVKQEVDRDRIPGRFILTGSANPLSVSGIADSLAGRMEIFTLRPFSVCELLNSRSSFIDKLFNPSLFKPGSAKNNEDIEDILLKGGFPEVNFRAREERRNAWFNSYISALMQKDIRDLAHIEGLTRIPPLLHLLASRAAGLLNMSDISRGLGITYTTLTRYFSLLEALFLVFRLNPWHVNTGKRLVKAPKLHVCDSGLAAFLCGLSAERIRTDRMNFGKCLEGFVVNECIKQCSWLDNRMNICFFRTSAGAEADVVLEDKLGRVAGIEIKASSTADKKDFSGLISLRETAGPRFTCGCLLYTGTNCIPFEKNLWAVPISALWTE